MKSKIIFPFLVFSLLVATSDRTRQDYLHDVASDENVDNH